MPGLDHARTVNDGMGSGLVRWLSRLFAAAVIAGALAYIPYRVYGSDGYIHYRKLRQQRDDMRQKNAELAAQNARLGRRVRRLEKDPVTIGQVARDDLGMVAADEIVIQIDRSLSGATRPLRTDDLPAAAPVQP